MGLRYNNLNEQTRQFMLEEIDMDVESGAIYISNYFNPRGCDLWPHTVVPVAATLALA